MSSSTRAALLPFPTPRALPVVKPRAVKAALEIKRSMWRSQVALRYLAEANPDGMLLVERTICRLLHEPCAVAGSHGAVSGSHGA